MRRAVGDALDPETAKRVVSVGLSTQRESCVIWDRRSGEALTPVLSWQDQRTESVCASLRASGPRRRHPPQERAAARSHVLRRQGALAPRPPPIGAGARQGGGDLHRHDRLVSPVALRRRGGRRGRQRLAHAALRRRRRALGRGAAVDLRRAPRRHAARRRVDRAVSGGARARALARRRSGRRGDGRFPFRSLRPRRLCAGAGQGDARDRLFSHGARRPEGRQRRRRRRARRLPDARVADRRADAGVRGQYPVRRIDARSGRRNCSASTPRSSPPRGDSARLARRLSRAGVRRPRRAVVGRVRGRRR